ncbi:MAG: transcriptional regulator [Oscillospiraceae bacterium]|nr:transcriptional regulator [Oscillospiraceae bacterium]
MRELTFKGFLAGYVKGLSGSRTLDLTALAAEAADKNHRLRAPLLLYAVTHGKADTLRSNLIKQARSDELLNMLSRLEHTDIENVLETGALPEEYCKVWNSFKVKHDEPETEEQLKARMREKILRLQATKRCSNYRLYKDLALNPGNINSWLKNGDNRKVSYSTAQKIINYVTDY